ncbi:MAG TPA: phage portal protein [Planctomycetota bacterium]|jgi:integrase
MFGWVTRLLRSAKPAARVIRLGDHDWQRQWDRIGVGVQAKYDAAVTNTENRRHWANADNFSANASNTPGVRRTLRSRTRYEVANNPHARNIMLSLANYTIGTGPRLQMQTPNEKLNKFIETEFSAWMLAVDLPGKLRTMRIAKAEDGESFGVFTNRPNGTPVLLDIRIVEADQVADPYPQTFFDPKRVDGIVLDDFGEPVEYHVLKYHPGDHLWSLDFTKLPAKSVLHYYRVDRPGQARGIPELTPALPLFALLRRYILATLTAAETAANVSAVLKTVFPPSGDDEGNGAGNASSIPPGMSIEVERNALISLPEGWDISQFRAEHPTATFKEFHDCILGDIGCVLTLPFNVVACNSSGYNYASGRLDYQGYDLALKVERIRLMRELTLETVEKYLSRRLDEGKAAKTANGMLTCLKAVLNWAVRTRRIPYNPIACIAPVEGEKRHVRRAMSDQEISLLLAAAVEGPTRRGMRKYQNRPRKDGTYKTAEVPLDQQQRWLETGRNNALAYRLMVEVGLRRNEARSVSWADIDLDAGTITTRPQWDGNKNGKEEVLPLTPGLLEALTVWRKTHKGPDYLPVTKITDRLLRWFDDDLVAAGLAKRVIEEKNGKRVVRIDKRDSAGRVLDLHALRHTFGTRLGRMPGVDPKSVQTLMRHSDPRMTFGVYVHSDKARLAAAVAQLPKIGYAAPQPALAPNTKLA